MRPEQVDNRNGNLEATKGKMVDMLEKLRNSDASIAKAIDECTRSAEKIQRDVSSEAGRLKRRIADIMKEAKKDWVERCIAKAEREIPKIEDTLKTNLQACNSTANSNFQSLKNKLDDVTSETGQLLETLKKIIPDCVVESAATAGPCIQDKLDATSSRNETVTEKLKGIVSESARVTGDVVKAATQCHKKAFDEASVKLKAVDKTIENCKK